MAQKDMTPNLTPEQKEHLKIAHRANMRIEETWSLFCMYLSQDKHPAIALELAQGAVATWAAWMDENVVEPPEIERPDFGQQLKDAMQMVADKMPQMSIAQLLQQPPPLNVDAEVDPDEVLRQDRDAEVDGSAARRAEQESTALSNPSTLADSTTQTKGEKS